MTTVKLDSTSAALEALGADGPHPDHADELMLFGQLVGEWEVEGVEYAPDGTSRRFSGEWHFDWVLDGRGVQDVLISPARNDRVDGEPFYVYGTSLRYFDPRLEGWRVVWADPVTGNFSVLTATRVGEEIVIEGTTDDGRPKRWIWSELTPMSARWRDEVSSDGGATWRMREEMRLRRRG